MPAPITTTGVAPAAIAPPAAATPDRSTKPRPRLWLRLSIARGNLIQSAGIVLGIAVLTAATMPAPEPAKLALTVLAWLAIYNSSHSIAHFLAGRAVGIRFRFYGLRGTDHPEDYPPGLRQLMSIAPFWSVITDKDSMRAATPWRKAVMFAAGETSTAICSIATAYAAAALHLPGSGPLLMFTILWNTVSTVVTAITPKGDYAKALRALRATAGSTR